MLDKKLLLPDLAAGQTRLDRAAEEGIRAKRCVGSLRYLWRNSPSGAHSVKVMEMKECLQSSPVQLRRMNADAAIEDKPQDDPSSDEERGPPEGNEEVAGDNDSTADDGSSDQGDLERVQSPERGCSEDSLKAPTLRLGWDPEVDTLPSVDSDGEALDSQRPGAWIGKFYKNHRTMGDLQPSEVLEIHSHDETDKDDSDDSDPTAGDDEEPDKGEIEGDTKGDNVSDHGEDKGGSDDDALECAVDHALEYIKCALSLSSQHVMNLPMLF